MLMKNPLLIWFCALIIVLAIWDGVWKLIALWKSARNNQLAWFVCLAIFNTAGILPILYITLFQNAQLPGRPVPGGAGRLPSRAGSAGNRPGEGRNSYGVNTP
jgi:hypothetical protein